MNTAQITAAPSPIRVGDRDLLMSPLTDADIGILENWVRGRVRDAVLSNLEGLSPDERQRQIDRLYERLPNVTAWSADAVAHLSSVAGSVKSLWLAIRKNHPDVAEDWLTERLSDPAALMAVLAEQQELERAQLPKFTPSAKPGKPAKRKRRR